MGEMLGNSSRPGAGNKRKAINCNEHSHTQIPCFCSVLQVCLVPCSPGVSGCLMGSTVCFAVYHLTIGLLRKYLSDIVPVSFTISLMSPPLNYLPFRNRGVRNYMSVSALVPRGNTPTFQHLKCNFPIHPQGSGGGGAHE